MGHWWYRPVRLAFRLSHCGPAGVRRGLSEWHVFFLFKQCCLWRLWNLAHHRLQRPGAVERRHLPDTQAWVRNASSLHHDDDPHGSLVRSFEGRLAVGDAQIARWRRGRQKKTSGRCRLQLQLQAGTARRAQIAWAVGDGPIERFVVREAVSLFFVMTACPSLRF